jgi:hypothetical protein
MAKLSSYIWPSLSGQPAGRRRRSLNDLKLKTAYGAHWLYYRTTMVRTERGKEIEVVVDDKLAQNRLLR